MVARLVVPWAILVATAFDLLCMLFRRFDINCDVGCEFPRGWIAWGTREAWDYGHRNNVRYFLLRLPSWQWVRPDRYCWGQLTLLRIRGEWHVDYWRVA
jgi:hypothetical protein